jgi:hypothetical protein
MKNFAKFLGTKQGLGLDTCWLSQSDGKKPGKNALESRDGSILTNRGPEPTMMMK